MMRLRKDESGISEIVGAIMLVLIVVIAASSFALFISEKQKDAEKQSLYDQERSLESISTLNLVGDINNVSSSWSSLNFTVASLCTEDSVITGFTLNDHILRYFNVTDSTGSTSTHSFLDDITLTARSTIYVHIDLNATSVVDLTSALSTSSMIKIVVLTDYQNEFSKTFTPPNSVILSDTHSFWNGTEFSDYLVLDGSESTAYSDAYIVAYHWSIFAENKSRPDGIWTNLTGQNVRYDYPLTNGNYTILLKVTDNYGMIGTSTVTFKL